ncbi:MAG: stage V sporulation protein SpoVM [Clostridia bacterium]|nr:stage V sporulation protein SpoVM [Clostridia bacterium]
MVRGILVKVIVLKNPKFFGGILRLMFGIKKQSNT